MGTEKKSGKLSSYVNMSDKTTLREDKLNDNFHLFFFEKSKIVPLTLI